MSLIMADGYDHYNLEYYKWCLESSSYVNVNDGQGRGGGGAMYNDRAGFIGFTFPDGHGIAIGDTAIMGVAIYAHTTWWRLGWGTVNTVMPISLWRNSNGTLSVYRGDADVELYTTDVAVVGRTHYWYYIEWKVLFSNTVGTVEVRVNEKTVINLTGQDTIHSDAFMPVTGYGIMGPTSAGMYTDDLYICDGKGDENNDFLGDVSVVGLFPSGAGAHSDFTPSGEATNYECVDDPFAIDFDTTYVGSSISGEIDTYEFDQLPSCEVLGVQYNIFARAEVGSRVLRPIFRSGGVDHEFSGEIVVGAGWSMEIVMMDYISPATDSQWTDDEINAGEFGYQIVEV